MCCSNENASCNLPHVGLVPFHPVPSVKHTLVEIPDSWNPAEQVYVAIVLSVERVTNPLVGGEGEVQTKIKK